MSGISEITDKTYGEPGRVRGRVFYDGACSYCTSLIRRFGPRLERRGFETVPLQSPGVGESLGLSPEELLAEMRVLTADGHLLGGADAIVYLAREIGWGWPLWALSHLPGARPLLRAGYRWIAARRSCAHGACEVPREAARREEAGRRNPARARGGARSGGSR